MRSQALKGRHNTAHGVNPVLWYSPTTFLPLHAPTARGGGGEEEAYLIGLTPYPMLCRHSMAIHLTIIGLCEGVSIHD